MIETQEVFSDIVGSAIRPDGLRLSQLDLTDVLENALIGHLGGDVILTPPQEEAIKRGVLQDDAHFLVSAPTNSGKTLIALLRVFQRSVARGGRFVYVVPLKALAEQKTDELQAIASQIVNFGGRKIDIGISTGDYRISEDFPDSPPDEKAEILVCTPERLEVLLRNPAYHAWAGTVDTFVLDEFHLLGQGERGARFESLVTRLILTCPKSSFLALSATFGSVENVSQWMAQGQLPVRYISSDFRYPQLARRFLQVADKDEWVSQLALEVSQDPDRSLLVFVYRQGDATRLAKKLTETLDNQELVGAFHSGLPLQLKKRLANDFSSRRVRILVCTTTLAMGVNTPATDVIVRDTVFHGFGRLGLSDILQMTGRAGRGNAAGKAIVLFSATEDWQFLATAVGTRRVDPLHPQLIPVSTKSRRHSKEKSPPAPPLVTALLGEIATKSHLVMADVETFVSHTYSAACHGISSADIRKAVQHLEADKLVYRVENMESGIAATKLGRTVSYSGLQAETGAMFGTFLRALISLSEKHERHDGKSLLHRLTDLDLLALSVAAYECRGMMLAGSSAKDVNQINEYVESLPPDEKPLINLWRNPASSDYPTRRIISTLRFEGSDDMTPYWGLLRTAAMLRDYALSRSTTEEIGVRWGFKGDMEGRLLPTVSWLLNALANICTGNRCYRLDFLRMRVFELIQNLSVGGGLGKILSIKGVGIRTVEKLKAAGIRSFSDLEQSPSGLLKSAGVLGRQKTEIRKMLVRARR